MSNYPFFSLMLSSYLDSSDLSSKNLEPKKNAVIPDHVRDKLKMCSNDQLDALRKALIEQYDCLTILGEPGAGKSFVIDILKQLLTLFRCEVIVGAPTGIAAQNIGGKTYQSLFRINTSVVLPVGVPIDHEKKEKSVSEVVTGVTCFSRTLPSVVILDELSMIPSQDLVAMYQIACLVKGNSNIRFICVGDPMQLAPTSKNREVNYPWENAVFSDEDVYGSLLTTGPFRENETNPLVRAKPWISLTHVLNTNHRQSDDRQFMFAIRDVALGLPITTSSPLYRRIIRAEQLPSILKEDDSAIHLFLANAKVDAFNKMCFEKATTKKKVYGAYISSGYVEKYEDNTIHIRNSDNTKTTLNKIYWGNNLAIPLLNPLYVGAPFMIRYNISELDLWNGTQGTVESLEDNGIMFRVNKDSRVVFLEYISLIDVPTDNRGRPVAFVKALPGHLSAATTVHKTQGITIHRNQRQKKDAPICVVHLFPHDAKFISADWLTVAISRTKTLNDLIIVEH